MLQSKALSLSLIEIVTLSPTFKFPSASLLGPTKTNPEKVKDIHFKKIIVKCNTIEEAKKYRTICRKFKEYADKKNYLKMIYDIE